MSELKRNSDQGHEGDLLYSHNTRMHTFSKKDAFGTSSSEQSSRGAPAYAAKALLASASTTGGEGPESIGVDETSRERLTL